MKKALLMLCNGQKREIIIDYNVGDNVRKSSFLQQPPNDLLTIVPCFDCFEFISPKNMEH